MLRVIQVEECYRVLNTTLTGHFIRHTYFAGAPSGEQTLDHLYDALHTKVFTNNSNAAAPDTFLPVPLEQ